MDEVCRTVGAWLDESATIEAGITPVEPEHITGLRKAVDARESGHNGVDMNANLAIAKNTLIDISSLGIRGDSSDSAIMAALGVGNQAEAWLRIDDAQGFPGELLHGIAWYQVDDGAVHGFGKAFGSCALYYRAPRTLAWQKIRNADGSMLNAAKAKQWDHSIKIILAGSWRGSVSLDGTSDVVLRVDPDPMIWGVHAWGAKRWG